MRYYEHKFRRKGFTVIAGVDESGRGPLAGPVVASCVILHKKRFSNPIRDSKQLSAKRREAAYKEIADNATVGIGIIDETTIDEVNIYQASLRAMEVAVGNLGTTPDYVLVDGIARLHITHPHTCIKGGDAKSITIAAASIAAKVTRDAIMQRYDSRYPHYGFAQHKGYPTKAHLRALKRFGPSPIHRTSFTPVARFL
jgi:ribonuclease HII